MMKLVVGLGNPGEKYAANRHNAGFMVADALAEKHGVSAWESKFGSLIAKVGEILLVKPQMFMNKSGEVVSQVVNFYKVQMTDLWVIHDDLDLPLGEYKIQAGVGPKAHNGVNSIERQLGRDDFWRVRVGVDSRSAGPARTPGEDYVLADFGEEERVIVVGVIKKVVVDLSSTKNL